MTHFVLAALAGFMLAAWPAPNWLVLVARWTLLILAALLLAVLLSALFGPPLPGTLGYDFLAFVEDLTDPRTMQTGLGAGFGFAFRRNLWRWRVARDRWVAVALAVVLAVGLAGPYTATLFSRVTRLTTPWGEAQFAAAPATQRQLKSEKRIYFGRVALSYIKGLRTPIGQDIDFLNLTNPNILEKRKENYEAADRFLESVLIPLVACAEDARTNKHVDIESIRQTMRPVARKMTRMLYDTAGNPKAQREAFLELIKTVQNAKYSILRLIDRPSPRVCFGGASSRQKVRLIERVDVGKLAENSYSHVAFGYLSMFTGNVEGALIHLKNNYKTFKNDINYNYVLALLLYTEERDHVELLPYFERALTEVIEAHNRVTAEEGSFVSNPEIRDELTKRFDGQVPFADLKSRYGRAIPSLKNSIAYNTARAVASDEEGTMRWERRARQYARDLKDIIDEQSPSRKAIYLDTIAYVEMVFEAREWQPDDDKIRDARKLLEEAKALVLEEARVLAISISDESDSGWANRQLLKSTKAHLRQADALLGDR